MIKNVDNIRWFDILVSAFGHVMKTAAQINEEIQDLVSDICGAAEWISTNPKAGADAVEYLHIPEDAIELVGELAALRGKASDYTGRIVKAYATLAKTAQTTQDKSETSRKDTLDKDAKRKAFNAWVSKLFTVVESEASVNKKGMADLKDLWPRLKQAQDANDTALVEELNKQIEAVMTR